MDPAKLDRAHLIEMGRSSEVEPADKMEDPEEASQVLDHLLELRQT